MEQKQILVNDFNPYKNWSVAGCHKNVIWVHLSAPLDSESLDFNLEKTNSYDVSTLYEVNLDLNEWRKIFLVNGIYVLHNLLITEKFLYASVLIDSNQDGKINNDDYNDGKKLLRMDRQSGDIKELWTFTNINGLPSIENILDDNYVLINLTFKNAQGEVLERYDILDISKNHIETIYIHNEEMVDTRVFLTKGTDGIKLILDLHITPSDKHVSGGKPDKIIVLG